MNYVFMTDTERTLIPSSPSLGVRDLKVFFCFSYCKILLLWSMVYGWIQSSKFLMHDSQRLKPNTVG